MNLPVAILAGGLATRLHPITEHIPKALIDVGGRPFAAHQLDLLRAHGIRDVVMLVGHFGEAVRDALGDGSRYGVRLRYVFDGPVALGTGGAVRRALAELGPIFFVLYGDSYLECDYEEIARAFSRRSSAGLMTVYRNEDRFDSSNVLYADGRLLQYDKRNRPAGACHIDYGLGVFRRSAFEGWPDDQPFDLSTVYQRLLADGELMAYEVMDRFFEIGSISGLEETRAHLLTKGASVR
jgi:NDP-sugar pyrophosphorylase family protein